MSHFKIGDKVALKDDHTGLVGYEEEGYTYRVGDIFEVVDYLEGPFWIAEGRVLIDYASENSFDLVENKAEQVHSPKHYNVLEDIEAIQIIAGSMTQEMFKGYCLGNILKYRLRCGAKDDVNQELAKADKYKELFVKYKHLCKEQQ